MKLSSSFNALPPVAKPLPAQAAVADTEEAEETTLITTEETTTFDSFTSVLIADASSSARSVFTGLTEPYKKIWKQFSTPISEQVYEKSFQKILELEGGVSEHPNDRGGVCNLGVTQETYDSFRKAKNRPKQSVKRITKDEAKEIYKQYWIQSGADRLAPKYPGLAFVRFDTWVNMYVANGWVDRDGAGNSMRTLLQAREARYRWIVDNDPSQAVFLQGWLNRLEAVEAFAKALKTP